RAGLRAGLAARSAVQGLVRRADRHAGEADGQPLALRGGAVRPGRRRDARRERRQPDQAPGLLPRAGPDRHGVAAAAGPEGDLAPGPGDGRGRPVGHAAGDDRAELQLAVAVLGARLDPGRLVQAQEDARLVELVVEVGDERHLDGGLRPERRQQGVAAVPVVPVGGGPPEVAALRRGDEKVRPVVRDGRRRIVPFSCDHEMNLRSGWGFLHPLRGAFPPRTGRLGPVPRKLSDAKVVIDRGTTGTGGRPPMASGGVSTAACCPWPPRRGCWRSCSRSTDGGGRCSTTAPERRWRTRRGSGSSSARGCRAKSNSSSGRSDGSTPRSWPTCITWGCTFPGRPCYWSGCICGTGRPIPGCGTNWCC